MPYLFIVPSQFCCILGLENRLLGLSVGPGTRLLVQKHEKVGNAKRWSLVLPLAALVVIGLLITGGVAIRTS